MCPSNKKKNAKLKRPVFQAPWLTMCLLFYVAPSTTLQVINSPCWGGENVSVFNNIHTVFIEYTYF